MDFNQCDIANLCFPGSASFSGRGLLLALSTPLTTRPLSPSAISSLDSSAVANWSIADARMESQGLVFVLYDIFFAISSATIRSDTGMKGLLLQPGREEETSRSPGGHRVTGWLAISRSRRAASSSRVSPINVLLLLLRMRLGCAFLTKLFEVILLLTVGFSPRAQRAMTSRALPTLLALAKTKE